MDTLPTDEGRHSAWKSEKIENTWRVCRPEFVFGDVRVVRHRIFKARPGRAMVVSSTSRFASCQGSFDPNKTNTFVKKTRIMGLAGIVNLALIPLSHGAVISTGEVGVPHTAFDSAVGPSLISTNQSSLASMTVSRLADGGAAFPNSGLNDGLAADSPTSTGTFYQDLRTSVTITFQLTQAYDITRIESVAGFGSGFYGAQRFDLLFEIGGSGVFVPAGSFNVSPNETLSSPTVGTVDFGTKVSIFNDAGPGAFVASDVTGIRFVYSDPYLDSLGFNTLNGSLIREISAFGTQTVPEPSVLVLSSLCVVSLCGRRVRSRA